MRSQMLIQKLRLQRGWSQEQLAELSGLSIRTIQRIERGQTASVESLNSPPLCRWQDRRYPTPIIPEGPRGA
jgi:transcriptional regulator with XRE-family HTH domain